MFAGIEFKEWPILGPVIWLLLFPLLKNYSDRS